MKKMLIVITALFLTSCNVPKYRTEFVPIITNPPVEYHQANAICQPLAIQAGNSARASVPTSSGGGFWAGFAEGANKNMSYKNAYDSVIESCLASQGWRINRVRIN